jgi:hypothetical protein
MSGSDSSWLRFPQAWPSTSISRKHAVQFLEEKKTQSAFWMQTAACVREVQHRVIGSLPNLNFVIDHMFWVGVYSGSRN